MSNAKYGSTAGSKFAALGDGASAVSALNLNYTDSGLFGFVAAAPAASAGKVVGAAVAALRSASVDDAQLARAKSLLKADLLMATESTANLLEEIALQSLLKGDAAGELLAAVDQVTLADVNAAAAKVASGKLAMGALGNLSSTPFVDEL